jgi:hypothetical protein
MAQCLQRTADTGFDSPERRAEVGGNLLMAQALKKGQEKWLTLLSRQRRHSVADCLALGSVRHDGWRRK